MLSIIKKYLKAIILTFFLLIDIIFANIALSGQYDSLYNELNNDSKSYKSQSTINNMKDSAPQYDESKTNYQDAKDQESADMFRDYGTNLTDSCTVSTKKETKKAVCDERIEYEYENVGVTQSKILDEINYSKNTITEIITKYYCDLTDTTYDTQTQCESECEDTQEIDVVYTCTEGTYNSSTGKCETIPTTTTDFRGCSAISYWDSPSNADTIEFSEDAFLYYKVASGDFSLSLSPGETYTSTGTYLTSYYSNNSDIINYKYKLRTISTGTGVGGGVDITQTLTFNRNTCELIFDRDVLGDAWYQTDDHFVLQPGESGTYGAWDLITLKNTSTLETIQTCPSGTILSGGKCISEPSTSKDCPAGYTLIDSNTCLKTESCSDMPTTEETTIYEAKYSYYYNPPSFDPLVNCSFSQFLCIDSRNTCVTKNASQSCIEYDNVCYEYKRSGICQKKIKHIYTDCNYNVTSEPAN